MDGDSDSQLTTSIYLDNYALELYRGRLEKSPGAIALRFRWYGNGEDPTTVYVERKTHRESWMGEVSVKERFMIREDQVLPLLQGKFDLQAEIDKLHAKGKTQDDIDEYTKLAKECIQAIQTKQLVPTMRTQYMRTAFQIPFDATVRISLDTSLTMIYERTKDALAGKRWFRETLNPSINPIPSNEITRFPHAILEIKLQIQDENSTPQWVTNLLQSGKLLEVHKFSKFIHGCAVLLPKDVYALPYWVDDVTVRESIVRSGGGILLQDYVPSADDIAVAGSGKAGSSSPNAPNHKRKSAKKVTLATGGTGTTNPLLPHDQQGNIKPTYLHKGGTNGDSANSSLVQRNSALGRESSYSAKSMQRDSVLTKDGDDDEEANKGHDGDDDIEPGCCAKCYGFTNECCETCALIVLDDCVHCFNDKDSEGRSNRGCCSWAASAKASHITTQKVEPKLFFANERTFISWLQMSIMMTTIAVAISAFAETDRKLLESCLLLPIKCLFPFSISINSIDFSFPPANCFGI